MIRKLQSKADQILKNFDEVDEVILFGSLARGDYGTDSDADILLVLTSSSYNRYFDRIPKYAPAFIDFDLPVNIFPYTHAEIDKMVESNNPFMKSILRDGVSLSKRGQTP